MHPAAQIAGTRGLNHEVEMVGHQAIAQHRHGHFDTGVSHGLEEGFVVAILPEDFASVVAAIEGVATFAIKGGSRDSGHGEKITVGE